MPPGWQPLASCGSSMLCVIPQLLLFSWILSLALLLLSSRTASFCLSCFSEVLFPAPLHVMRPMRGNDGISAPLLCRFLSRDNSQLWWIQCVIANHATPSSSISKSHLGEFIRLALGKLNLYLPSSAGAYTLAVVILAGSRAGSLPCPAFGSWGSEFFLQD